MHSSPVVVAEDLDSPAVVVGDLLREAATTGLAGTPAHAVVYAYTPPGEDECPICHRRNGHDWAMQTASADYARGLIQL